MGSPVALMVEITTWCWSLLASWCWSGSPLPCWALPWNVSLNQDWERCDAHVKRHIVTRRQDISSGYLLTNDKFSERSW